MSPKLPGSVDGGVSVEESRLGGQPKPALGSDTDDDGQEADILDMSQSLVSLDSHIDHHR